MDDPFRIGDSVRQKVVVLHGEVIDVQFDPGSSSFRYLVRIGDGDERWLEQEHIERTAP